MKYFSVLSNPSYKRSLLILVIVGSIVFFNTLFNGFVWLDKPYIVNNPLAQQMNFVQLIHGSSLTASSYYRPITAIYFSVVLAFAHNHAFVFHLLQIVIRLANAMLLFGIFTFFFKRPLALFLSLIYLVHPLIQGNVTYISASADALSMLFGLSAVFLTLRIDQKKVTRLFVFLLLLISILTKESGVLFLGIIFLFIALFRRKDTLYYSVWLTLTAMGYATVRFALYGIKYLKDPTIPIMQLSLAERLVSTPKIILYYLQNFIWPFSIGINNLWYVDKITFRDFYLPLVLDSLFFICTVLLGAYIYKRKHDKFHAYLFFFCLFWVGFSFYFQIIPLDYTVSGRWFAFPMIGLLGILGLFIQMLPLPKKSALIGASLIIILLSLRTMVRNTYWANDLALFSQSAKINTNFLTENNLAGAYYDKGNYAQALIHMQKSIALIPTDRAYAQEGLILRKLGKEDAANAAFETALSTASYGNDDTHDVATYVTLAKYLIRIHDYNRAEDLLNDARMVYPYDQTLWILTAFVEYFLQNKDNALLAIKQAQTLSINSANDQFVADAYRIIQLNLPLDPDVVGN